ncbi:DNA alkylation repair protein [Rossellomorea aquimaris]|uniref:DNA alkylation repair protein n=1 Tax=Rossellomorea aquimaris TaxID=189382 RepID=UPI0007D04136|nr:DNA alkylation repair protein [Rossellomorea aquimaris]
MTYEEVMEALEHMGNEQTKNIYLRHGAQEPFFGVKIGDMKKLVKHVKKDQNLAITLYNSGNHDAMYLAGLSIDPKKMKKETLQEWVEKANWYMLSEYTVANVTAESNYPLELAREWIQSDKENIASAGWSAYAGYISITSDDELYLEEIKTYLHQIEENIHQERNRVRYTMNGFVISVGAHVIPLLEEAKKVATSIGKVHVDVGNTACKVPMATDYIKKIEEKNRVGAKRKTCIC